MKKIYLTLALLGCTVLSAQATEADSTMAVSTAEPTAMPTLKVDSATSTTKSTAASRFMKAFNPSIKFGGYIMGKYSWNDRAGQESNGGFDLRYLRLYANGYAFKDFYYRFQLEVNGAPGEDKGPRIVDAFIEWQKYDFLRVKLGQFKRPYGFENPYNPIDVGFGSYSQATSKITGMSDRCGEHKSGGRDVGLQLQGDLFRSKKDGHPWLHYQVGVFNGQGINHTDKDKSKDIIGGLWVSPIKNLSIGGFGWNGTYVNEKYDPKKAQNTSEPYYQQKKIDRKRWGAGLKYEDKWTVRAEYMHSVGGVVTDYRKPTKSDAWYAAVGAPLFKNFKLYGKWDCYRDAKTWSSMKTDWALSANYYLSKNFVFQLNYIFTDDRSTTGDRYYNTLDVQVTARF